MPIRWLTVFLDLPAPGFSVAEQFWLDVTAGARSARRGPDGEFATVLPAHGDAYLRVQRIRDGVGGCHLDLHIDRDVESLAEVAARAVDSGARVRHVEDDLIVLESPGGFTFCLVTWGGETTVPGPIRLDFGGANRLDQLCLDIPPDQFEAECGFWRSLTGWQLRAGSLPEFAYLERPTGIPVRLLFQRLAQTGRDEVCAHVDFACADVHALSERHVAAGAQVLARFARWTTMIDPVGQPYCLTERSV